MTGKGGLAPPLMTVRQLAHQGDVTVHVVRNYLRSGLLQEDYDPAESLVFEDALASTAIPIASSGVRPKRAVRWRNSMTSSRRAPASMADKRCWGHPSSRDSAV